MTVDDAEVVFEARWNKWDESEMIEFVKAKDAEMREWEETLATATAGLIPTTYAMIPADSRQIAVSPKKNGLTVRLYEGTLEGERIVMVHMHVYDDDRTTYYGSPALVEKIHRDYAEKCGIDRRKAQEWLANYRGCFGQELYLQIAGES